MPGSAQTSTLLVEFFKRYKQEVLLMPNMLEEFARETFDPRLKDRLAADAAGGAS